MAALPHARVSYESTATDLRANVEASSRWYQELLGCESAHGGPEYERLVSRGRLILQLHRWDVEHHHGQLGDPNIRPYGNGVLLWFERDDFDAAVARAEHLTLRWLCHAIAIRPTATAVRTIGKCGFATPDGYTVVLASPDGSADGSWRPAR